MTALTAKQRKVLQLILVHLVAHGYPPTLRYLARHLGFRGDPHGAVCHLRALEAKGYLRRPEPRGPRAITLPGCRLDRIAGVRTLCFEANEAGGRLYEAFSGGTACT